jgi:hypothetical protein
MNGKQNDLGSKMQGYYLEAGYNVFKHLKKTRDECIPFARIESYDTHLATMNGLSQNKSYHNKIITTGITYKLGKGAVVKTDLQFVKSEAAKDYSKQFSAGFGVMF